MFYSDDVNFIWKIIYDSTNYKFRLRFDKALLKKWREDFMTQKTTLGFYYHPINYRFMFDCRIIVL